MTSTKPPVVIEERSARPAFTPRAGRWARTLPFLGPAFVAAVAYVDPGNFATNFSGGASFVNGQRDFPLGGQLISLLADR
jgi:hypothetical protein